MSQHIKTWQERSKGDPQWNLPPMHYAQQEIADLRAELKSVNTLLKAASAEMSLMERERDEARAALAQRTDSGKVAEVVPLGFICQADVDALHNGEYNNAITMSDISNAKHGKYEVPVYVAAPAADSAATEQAAPAGRDALVAAGLAVIKHDYSPECLRMASTKSYVEDAVGQLVDAGWQPAERAVEPDMRELLDKHDPMNPQPGCCHMCGLPMTKNPHPDAGKMATLLEVGTPYECIPCLTKSRHQWSRRAMLAETELRAAAPASADVGEPTKTEIDLAIKLGIAGGALRAIATVSKDKWVAKCAQDTLNELGVLGAQASSAVPANVDDLIERHRIAITPEYEGIFTAEIYGDEATVQAKGEGHTVAEAIRAALSASAEKGDT